MAPKTRIQQHISNGNTEEAIELLLQYTSTHEKLHHQVVIIASRYQRWKEQEVYVGESNPVELNKIHRAILELSAQERFRELEKSSTTQTESPANQSMVQSSDSLDQSGLFSAISPIQFLYFSVLGFCISLGLGILLLFYSDKILSLRFVDRYYYLLLIPVSLSVAAFLFGSMKAHAGFFKKTYKSRIQIGGPILVFFLVIIVGFILAPMDSKTQFDYVIYLENDLSVQTTYPNTSLTLFLGQTTQTKKVGKKGECRFDNIPISFLLDSVNLEIRSPNWRFENDRTRILTELCEKEFRYITVSLKSKCTKFFGKINKKGFKKDNFLVELVGATDPPIHPDATGQFSFTIPHYLQNEDKQTIKITQIQENQLLEYEVFPCQKNNHSFSL